MRQIAEVTHGKPKSHTMAPIAFGNAWKIHPIVKNAPKYAAFQISSRK
jgi:hypothetical protein